jgi:PTH2 family peptidyl-tRNA hydrolase
MECSADDASSSKGGQLLWFLAGTLLPTLAYALMVRSTNKRVVNTTHENSQRESDEEDSDEEDMNVATTGGVSSQWGMRQAPYKMVFCVNTSLSMGKGKIAAQCCHAAVGCYKRATKQCPAALRAWEYSGCAKICIKCPEEDELLEIAAKALSLDIPVYFVQDAGRTQIAAGSRTVLGLFGPASVFEGVTDHLKLM